MGGGVLWSALLVFLLTYAIASSTATAAWVTGHRGRSRSSRSAAALLMAVLAVLPVPWPTGLALGMILGPFVALIAAGPTLHAAHPLIRRSWAAGGLSLRIVSTWWTRLTDGEAANDPAFYLFLICWLMWVTGAWLSWCVLRWRKPMLGLVPGAAAFATNLLNYPLNQNGLHAQHPRPDPRPSPVDELHGLDSKRQPRACQADRRRALGFLGKRARCDGGADRARRHAASNFNSRPHNGRRVGSLHELGPAAAKALHPYPAPSGRAQAGPGPRAFLLTSRWVGRLTGRKTRSSPTRRTLRSATTRARCTSEAWT